MKKLLVLLLAFLLSLSALSASRYVQDDIRILSENAVQPLEDYYKEVSDYTGFTVGVHSFQGLENDGKAIINEEAEQEKNLAYIRDYVSSTFQAGEEYFLMFVYSQGEDIWYQFHSNSEVYEYYGDDCYAYIWSVLLDVENEDQSYYDDFTLFGECTMALCDYYQTELKGGADADGTVSLSTFVVDEANLLSAEEEATLNEDLWNFSQELGYPVMVATVNGVKGKNTIDDSDLLLEAYVGINGDGVMLYINMGDRKWNITTSGQAITDLNDRALERLEGVFLSDLSNGQYLKAFESFGASTRTYALNARKGEAAAEEEDTFDLYFYLFLGLILGVISGGITVSVMKKKLKTAVMVDNANDFAVKNSFLLTGHSDVFLYKHVSRTKIEKSSSNGSSTHFSSSGGSHGGRSGSF